MYARLPRRAVTASERSSLEGLTDPVMGLPEWLWLALLVGGGGYVAYHVVKKGVGF